MVAGQMGVAGSGLKVGEHLVDRQRIMLKGFGKEEWDREADIVTAAGDYYTDPLYYGHVCHLSG